MLHIELSYSYFDFKDQKLLTFLLSRGLTRQPGRDLLISQAYSAHAACPGYLEYLAYPAPTAHATYPAHSAYLEYLACPTRPVHAGIAT